FLGAHAFPQRFHPRPVALFLGIRILAAIQLLLFVLQRHVNLAAMLLGILHSRLIRKTTIHGNVGWQATVILLGLFQHRLHQTAIAALIVDLDLQDNARVDSREALHVIGLSRATIGHLHVARIGIRTGDAWSGLFLVLA